MATDSPIDMTDSHSEQHFTVDGKKHVTIKPIRVIRKVNDQGGVDITVVVPQLSTKPRLKNA